MRTIPLSLNFASLPEIYEDTSAISIFGLKLPEV
jgi:hypothetical protein